MISLFLIFFAAIANAIMDNLVHHYYKSIFNNSEFDPKFWNPDISWIREPLARTGYKLDAWHIFKSAMIVFMVLAVISYSPILGWFGDLCIYGLAWNLIFNLFYNHVLNR